MRVDHMFAHIANGLESKDVKLVCHSLKQISRVRNEELELLEELIPIIIALLDSPSSDIRSCCCWTLGQIGFHKPDWVENAMPRLAKLIVDPEAKVREKAIWTTGRIGRAKPDLVKEYIQLILDKAEDVEPKVRMNCIWACENIATVYPEWFSTVIPVFIRLLDDPDTKYVRSEAPEIFRVIGKRRPDIVSFAIPKLIEKTQDDCRVTRVHAKGALRAIQNSKM